MKRRNFLQSLAIATVAPKIITDVAGNSAGGGKTAAIAVDLATKGKDATSIVLWMKDGDNWKSVACLTSNQLSKNPYGEGITIPQPTEAPEQTELFRKLEESKTTHHVKWNEAGNNI